MDQMVVGQDIHIVAVTIGIAMLIAWEVGKWMGYRLRSERPVKPSKFDDASMALLGLLLAFTFGTSISKYDQRRLAVVADSNAIGDFYTCASLLKEPTRSKLESLIQQYTELRLDLAARQVSDGELESVLAKFDRMHGEMTELVGQALNDGTPIAVSLTNTLNAVTSNQASRLSAVRDRLPTIIVMLLFASAIITTLLLGREQGLADSPDVAGTMCFILLVGIAVYVTLDLNRPDRGLIRASQEPMERLLSWMRR